MSRYFAIAAALATLTVAASAQAGSSGTADTPCGYSVNRWNAPKGALVSSQSAGPVRDVVTGVGEYRSHSMFSHGTYWVSHASMYTPGTTGWPTYCSTPMKSNELQKGYPGASLVNMGAIYTYLYKNGTATFVKYQNGGCAGEKVANHLLSYNNGYRNIWWDGKLYRYLNYANKAINYSLYGFRHEEGANTDQYTTNTGMVCSAFVAWAQYRTGGFGSVSNTVYSQTKKYNAINALRNGVEDSCDDGLGFWSGLGASITCFEGICDDAGRQVANCMSWNGCNTDSNTWQTKRNDSNYKVYAISPDRVAGYNGHDGSGSIWEDASQYTVSWNQSGGNVYGCWF